MLLTALEKRFGCHLCIGFQPEFELLARSWLKGNKDSKAFFFANLDFQVGRATFQKVGDNLESQYCAAELLLQN